MSFAIKAKIADPQADTFGFTRQKTMYGGKQLAIGDEVFVFASETHGGRGLIAVASVTTVAAVPKVPGIARQTPLLDLMLRVTARARRPLGRAELKHFTEWSDGRPETELNFKYYRQATDKVVGLTESTAAFLRSFF